MPIADSPRDYVTDYERAICYYTLPKVVSPVTYGIVVAYSVCLFEAVGAVVIGTLLNSRVWIIAGYAALAGIIVFGLLVFMARALVNEVRQRKMLAVARGVPDAAGAETEVPDPFANHILLKHPLEARGRLFVCTENDATIKYFVDSAPNRRWWKIKTPQDVEVCHLEALGRFRRFTFIGGLPHRLGVYAGEEEIAQIVRRFSFTVPYVEIRCRIPEPRVYVVRQEGIYWGDCLIGRIYSLRRSFYLDMEKYLFHDAVLAYFVTKT